jgi:hypothetical protein
MAHAMPDEDFCRRTQQSPGWRAAPSELVADAKFGDGDRVVDGHLFIRVRFRA